MKGESVSKNRFATMALGVFVVATLSLLTACTTSTTAVNREQAARPRVEQKALTSAMEAAFDDIDFAFCDGKKIFFETKALSKGDIDYINSFIQRSALDAGCVPVTKKDGAEMLGSCVVEVSGTDEVALRMVRDVVIGQFTATLTVTDLASDSIIKAWKISGQSQTRRNKKATTRTLE